MFRQRRLAQPVEFNAQFQVGLGLSRIQFHGGLKLPDSFVIACDRAALEARIVRQSSEFAWAEETPAATRRFITNIRVERDGELLRVKSNLLLFRARWENVAFVSAERHDRWIVGPAVTLLAERWSYLDHTVLPVENLGVFL